MTAAESKVFGTIEQFILLDVRHGQLAISKSGVVAFGNLYDVAEKILRLVPYSRRLSTSRWHSIRPGYVELPGRSPGPMS